jgi:hypothetical protein
MIVRFQLVLPELHRIHHLQQYSNICILRLDHDVAALHCRVEELPS